MSVYASRITDTPGPENYSQKVGPAGASMKFSWCIPTFLGGVPSKLIEHGARHLRFDSYLLQLGCLELDKLRENHCMARGFLSLCFCKAQPGCLGHQLEHLILAVYKKAVSFESS